VILFIDEYGSAAYEDKQWEKPCGWLIRTLRWFAAGRWNLTSSSVSTALDLPLE
jgi:hypothetical protein